MIVFDDSLEAIWHIEVDISHMNWLGALSRSKEIEGGFEFNYRFRYYVDGDLTRNSKDRKNWYRAVMERTPLNLAIERTRVFVNSASAMMNGCLYECLRQGRTTEAMMAEWAAMPFVNLERVTVEEHDKGKS